MKKNIFIIGLLFIVAACQSTTTEKETITTSILEKVDAAHLKVVKNTLIHREVVTLDHHRMAQKDGAYTPPAIATVFADDSRIVSELLAKNQLVGMDMPFKIFAYSEPDTLNASYAYTSADFIMNRHGLSNEDVLPFRNFIDKAVSHLPSESISKTNDSIVYKGFGVIKIKSDYDFNTTMSHVRKIVNVNQDTRWFSRIDLQKDAKGFGIDLRPTTLCFFGAPKPGALAMHDAPKIGLDAFCQKVLVYQDVEGVVYLAFSDMTKFGELYYGISNKGQKIVTNRMTMALKMAVQKK